MQSKVIDMSVLLMLPHINKSYRISSATLIISFNFGLGSDSSGWLYRWKGKWSCGEAFSCLWFWRKMCSILLLVETNNKKLFTTCSCLPWNYEARVLYVYVEGVCVCVCLNSNVYRSFIKADRRRKQSLNTAIWPALAKLVAFKPSPYEGLQKLRPTAGSGSQPSDWRPGLGSDDFEDILKFCKHWPWSHQSNHRYE